MGTPASISNPDDVISMPRWALSQLVRCGCRMAEGDDVIDNWFSLIAKYGYDEYGDREDI